MSDFCEMADNVRRREKDPPGVVETAELYGDAVRVLRDATHATDLTVFSYRPTACKPHNINAEGEAVRRQPHYAYGIEPIEYMESRFSVAEFRGFLRGNVLKYMSRYTRKDGIRDLEKAGDYLARLIAFERKQEPKP